MSESSEGAPSPAPEDIIKKASREIHDKHQSEELSGEGPIGPMSLSARVDRIGADVGRLDELDSPSDLSIALEDAVLAVGEVAIKLPDSGEKQALLDRIASIIGD